MADDRFEEVLKFFLDDDSGNEFEGFRPEDSDKWTMVLKNLTVTRVTLIPR